MSQGFQRETPMAPASQDGSGVAGGLFMDNTEGDSKRFTASTLGNTSLMSG